MRKLDLTGQTFNRLTVIREVKSFEKDSRWLCKCICGNVVEIRGTAIKNGTTASCGCLARESAAMLNRDNQIVQIAHDKYNAKRIDGVATFLINDNIQKNTKSGYKGVLAYRLKNGEIRYQAYLSVNKKTYSKKGFKTAKEAHVYRLQLVDKHVPKGDKNEI